MVNKEFEPLSEQELKNIAVPMKKWRCQDCSEVVTAWSNDAPKECRKCSGSRFSIIMNTATVPATTGFEIELVYDNMDSIDEVSQKEYDIETQNRELEQLEKSRR